MSLKEGEEIEAKVTSKKTLYLYLGKKHTAAMHMNQMVEDINLINIGHAIKVKVLYADQNFIELAQKDSSTNYLHILQGTVLNGEIKAISMKSSVPITLQFTSKILGSISFTDIDSNLLGYVNNSKSHFSECYC